MLGTILYCIYTPTFPKNRNIFIFNPTNNFIVGKMSRKQVYALDSKHRITFPKDIVDKYGTVFAIVRLRDEVLLKPLPKDPLKALQKEGRKFKGMTASQLRKDFEKSLLERV